MDASSNSTSTGSITLVPFRQDKLEGPIEISHILSVKPLVLEPGCSILRIKTGFDDVKSKLVSTRTPYKDVVRLISKQSVTSNSGLSDTSQNTPHSMPKGFIEVSARTSPGRDDYHSMLIAVSNIVDCRVAHTNPDVSILLLSPQDEKEGGEEITVQGGAEDINSMITNQRI